MPTNPTYDCYSSLSTTFSKKASKAGGTVVAAAATTTTAATTPNSKHSLTNRYKSLLQFKHLATDSGCLVST